MKKLTFKINYDSYKKKSNKLRIILRKNNKVRYKVCSNKIKRYKEELKNRNKLYNKHEKRI